jgi:hypothetical protein
MHFNKMTSDNSTLNNVRDQRHDPNPNEDVVEERAAVPPADYVHEIEEVDETILLEVDEEDVHESFEHAGDHSAPALFDKEEEKKQIVTSEITIMEHLTQPWIHGTTALWTPS